VVAAGDDERGTRRLWLWAVDRLSGVTMNGVPPPPPGVYALSNVMCWELCAPCWQTSLSNAIRFGQLPSSEAIHGSCRSGTTRRSVHTVATTKPMPAVL